MNINRTNEIQGSDNFVMLRANGNQYLAVSQPVFLNWLLEQGYIPEPGNIQKVLTAQYSNPTTESFTVLVNQTNTRLIITPISAFNDMTIELPIGTEQSTVVVTCSQQITNLTVTAPVGVSVQGAPASLGAGAFCTFMYDAINSQWLRVA